MFTFLLVNVANLTLLDSTVINDCMCKVTFNVLRGECKINNVVSVITLMKTLYQKNFDGKNEACFKKSYGP